MCGRYSTGEISNAFRKYDIDPPEGYADSYNVAPGTRNPIIFRGSWKTILAKWGLIPQWESAPSTRLSTINAKAETVSTSSVFRDAFKKRRCLIPAAGFFEWKKVNDTFKIPFYISLKSRKTFFFAGLFNIWSDAEKKEFPSYTIITTSANSFMSEIHIRMPVILREEFEKEWTATDASEYMLLSLMRPYPSDEMQAVSVSRKVNSVANDDKDLILEDSSSLENPKPTLF